MDLLYAIARLRTPFLDRVMACITECGGEIFFIAAAIILFWCVNKRLGLYMLTVGFTGTILNQFLKLACRVPRPWVLDPDFTIVESARAGATGYSFPSGHTQNVFASFGCVLRWTGRTWLRAVCAVIIVLTAFSRMYLGVHTPWDVGVSFLLGTVLVLAVYPVFETLDEHPKRMYAVFGVMLLCSVLYLLYASFRHFPADVDPVNLAEGVGNAWKLLGAGLGMTLAYALDEHRIHFETRAVWWAQLLKAVLGLAVTVALRSVLKAPLLALFGGHPAAHFVRYFLVVLFAGGLWPMTFRGFSRLGRKHPSAD